MNAYQVLKKFLAAKQNRDKYNKEYDDTRLEVLSTLGEVDQKGIEKDIEFNIYPSYSNKINWGNFAKVYPNEFNRKKELEEGIKQMQKELKAIDSLAKTNFSYADTSSGPRSWNVKVNPIAKDGHVL